MVEKTFQLSTGELEAHKALIERSSLTLPSCYLTRHGREFNLRNISQAQEISRLLFLMLDDRIKKLLAQTLRQVVREMVQARML